MIAGLASGLVACRDAAARSGLSNARSSDRELVQDALDALATRDTATLEALLVTREEHRGLLWDQLPESTYFSFDYARLLNEHNTAKAIARGLQKYGGQKLELLDITYDKPTEAYSGFTLHLGAKIRVRRVSDGKEGTIRFVDVLVERNGGWKLMNYVE
jgi:hypothetical protein